MQPEAQTTTWVSLRLVRVSLRYASIWRRLRHSLTFTFYLRCLVPSSLQLLLSLLTWPSSQQTDKQNTVATDGIGEQWYTKSATSTTVSLESTCTDLQHNITLWSLIYNIILHCDCVHTVLSWRTSFHLWPGGGLGIFEPLWNNNVHCRILLAS